MMKLKKLAIGLALTLMGAAAHAQVYLSYYRNCVWGQDNWCYIMQPTGQYALVNNQYRVVHDATSWTIYLGAPDTNFGNVVTLPGTGVAILYQNVGGIEAGWVHEYDYQLQEPLNWYRWAVDANGNLVIHYVFNGMWVSAQDLLNYYAQRQQQNVNDTAALQQDQFLYEMYLAGQTRIADPWVRGDPPSR